MSTTTRGKSARKSKLRCVFYAFFTPDSRLFDPKRLSMGLGQERAVEESNMSSQVRFNDTFADFSQDVRAADRSPEVVDVVEDFVDRWGYGLGDLFGASFTTVALRENGAGGDLIFKLTRPSFYEIVLRDDHGGATYGGYLYGAEKVRVTDKLINGYRVIVTSDTNGHEILHHYSPGLGYAPVFASGVVPLSVARRMVA